MQIYVLNQSRNLAGIIESFEYFRWTRRYSQCGGFELKAVATPENIALLQIGNYLWKNDDSECGIIESLNMTMSEKEIIIVSGRFATSILSRRIIWGRETLSGDLVPQIRGLIQRHLTTQATTARRIDFLDVSDQTPYQVISEQVSYRNLLEVICDLCESQQTGLKTQYSPATKRFTVVFYKPGASQAVFSKEYENLIDQAYTESVSETANIALVGGEGEGADRVLLTIDTGGSTGESRREIFVDAKDLQSEELGTGYTAALTFRGQSALAELAPVRSFDAAVNPHGNLRYKMDYDLGQSVTVISKKWGVTLNARITEIEESYDVSGQSLNITFGKGVLTLFQKLKGAF
jgi:hypothetical protein